MNEWNPPYPWNGSRESLSDEIRLIDHFTAILSKMQFITRSQEVLMWSRLCPIVDDDEC